MYIYNLNIRGAREFSKFFQQNVTVEYSEHSTGQFLIVTISPRAFPSLIFGRILLFLLALLHATTMLFRHAYTFHARQNTGK